MTTRNFRVHNGISVGDITISASANTITGLTTAAPSDDGDVANKKYVDDSLAGLSQNSISQLDTNITVTDTGSDGTITMTADNTVVMTATSTGIVIPGNLTVQGTETIINTQNLLVEDAIIGLNANVSQAADMPRF